MPANRVRAGDTITIRNLPVTGSTLIDKIRRFTIAKTSFSVDDEILTLTPELETPSLEFLVAKTSAALGHVFGSYQYSPPVGTSGSGKGFKI
jgi:hypothetical protein